MSKKAKLLLAAGVALVALAGLTSSASAVRLQFRPGGAISFVSLGRLSFEGGFPVICNLTFAGSLRTEAIEAVRGTQLGSITATEANSCEGGEAQIINELLPWSITYNRHESAGGFEFTINGFEFLVEQFGTGCHYRVSLTGTLAWTRAGERTFTSGLVTSGGSATLVRRLFGLFSCSTTLRPRGSFSLSPAQTITEI
jgi:hypothetical protein